MNERKPPEWVTLTDDATLETMKRIAEKVTNTGLPLQVKNLPMQAHWFVLDSLLTANRVNREGMHALALALTRQSLEAVAIIELGLCKHPGASEKLLQWDADKLTPGELRKWLSENVWNNYGSGLWAEPWSHFMTQLARAIQPYAHYSTHLAKWQLRLHAFPDDRGDSKLVVEWTPRAYDAQKATRVTLFHSILTFALARIWIANVGNQDLPFAAQINRLRVALGKSKYLDGHSTDWEKQFWATMFSKKGGTILE
jgi:hypothetical protein